MPRGTTVVATSYSMGMGSAGMAKAMGFVPSMTSRPNVGTQMACVFVKHMPSMSSRSAIMA